jgi:integrase
MPRVYSHDLSDWVKANPTVQAWHSKKKKGSKNTAETYATMLSRYWKESLSPRGYKNLGQWVEEVKEQQLSRDVSVKRQWGLDLENYLFSTKLMGGSRFVLTQAVKSYLLEQTELASYEFSYQDKAEKIAERKAKAEQEPLKIEEIRTLIARAKPRDRAIILTMVSGGLGVGEFVQFAADWKKYSKAIQSKQVPIRIDITRPKTGVSYWTLLWDDAVDALEALLRERAGKEPLFVNQRKNPITEDDIQWVVRWMANKTGLDPSRGKLIDAIKGTKPAYRIRPHEFRDYFKTACENSEVPNSISEFCLGHTVDPLEYNKFSRTDEGKERIRKALSKVRPKLNIITTRGEVKATDSYFDKTVETWAIVDGKDPEIVKDKIIYYVKRLSPDEFMAALKDLIKKDLYHGEGILEEMLADPPRETAVMACQRMSKEQLLPVIVAMAKDKVPATKKVEQKVIHEKELEQYLTEGWTFRSVINSEKVLVERFPE